jgi:hypothetical protein
MKKTLQFFAGASLLCAASFTLAAQSADPPKILRIYREDIKEGKGAGHEKSEARFAQMLARVKYPSNSLAMTTMSGLAQAWFMEGHESYASIGETDTFVGQAPQVKGQFETLDAQDAEFRASSRTWIAEFRPGMSYHASQIVENLAKMRYFNVITFRVRLDRDQDFADLAKSAVAALDKSHSDQPVATYQIVSGAPNGTYLLFEPCASLTALDGGAARGQAMMQAMGTSGMAKFTKSAGETIASSDAMLFAINPRMSYPPKAVLDADPDYWKPKPAKAAAPAKPAAPTK